MRASEIEPALISCLCQWPSEVQNQIELGLYLECGQASPLVIELTGASKTITLRAQTPFSSIFIFSIFVTLVVVGTYLVIVFVALWLGDGDASAPIKISLLSGIVLVLGYSATGIVSIINETHKYELLLPAGGGLVLEAAFLWLEWPAVVEFLVNRQSTINLMKLPGDVRLLTTIGLGIVVVFFMLISKFVLTAAEIELRSLFRIPGARILLVLGSLIPLMMGLALVFPLSSQVQGIAMSVVGGTIALASLAASRILSIYAKQKKAKSVSG